jgi:c-di-GMP-binding flagellar brake protein YcgR
MRQAKDRRRWTRYKFCAPVRISVDGREHSSAIEGLCLTLSEGGMSLFAAANVAVGTKVRIEFLQPSADERACIVGTIRNRMVYLYGVEY